MLFFRSGNYFQKYLIRHKFIKIKNQKRNMAVNKYEGYIVWMDMELSGLDINNDHILEIACAVTDENLQVVSKELNIVINQPTPVLDNMDDWCKTHHKQSGLIQESLTSEVSLKDAETALLKYLKKFVPERSCPLAGNTVYMDRLFLMKYMPSVNDYLHYRIIDVSSIKEVTKRWNKSLYESAPKKVLHHRALPDIKESIEELSYYKNHVFVKKCI